jgi:DNA modification methylase
VWGGEAGCVHVWTQEVTKRGNGSGGYGVKQSTNKGSFVIHGGGPRVTISNFCSLCDAWRGELGHEPTPELFIDHLVEVFREVRRVLRKDGVLWLNIGDSYANDSKWGGRTAGKHVTALHGEPIGRARRHIGLKPKELIGIPWMLAFALRADGWLLRSECIWSKPNPMTESVEDRPTKAHEHVFLFTKAPKYFYDKEAVAEPQAEQERNRRLREYKQGLETVVNVARDGQTGLVDQSATGAVRNVLARQELALRGTRNRRTVWTIATQPYTEDHFAAYPEELAEICIGAGTSEKGCCSVCGQPWRRILGKGLPDPARPQAKRALDLFKEKGLTDAHLEAIRAVGVSDAGKAIITQSGSGKNSPEMIRLADEAKEALGGYFREFLIGQTSTIGWKPSCKCSACEPVPCTVLDPFTGRGTTGVVANRMGRNFVGVELKPEYVKMSRKNIHQESPLFNEELTA